ncbi:MAG TPA: class II fructose-bisphosphate aldolase [Pseudonocardiaceae bacterium]|jgi:fructose-bisphosphate aldolase class II|nr:class II fructose-bisphosphate aldolase [Pseudonocardiaceae bacterium]
MLTRTAEIIASAVERGSGVGAFNVIHLEHAEALVTGAEAAGRPVILQISQNAVHFHGALRPIAMATMAIARAADTPVAVHLDHATDVALVHEAVRLGFGSVMYDASTLSYQDNVARTREMAEHCHGNGVYVEAELGEVGGKDGVHAPGARTDPVEAIRYAVDTGVDALAVAVGTSHAMLTRDATVDLDLIGRLHEAVAIPLVLHGSSGVPDDQLAAAVRAGITKVNIATQFNKAFTMAVHGYLADHPDVVDTRKYFRAARDAVAAEAERLLAVLTR